MNILPALTLMMVLGQAPADKPQPPPLTEEQTKRLRALVFNTQETGKELQARLDDRQRQLAKVYMEFLFDAPKAEKLQAEIVDLQKQLLANHHKMQTELREIVPKERFELLRQRLERVLTPPGTKTTEPERPTKPADR